MVQRKMNLPVRLLMRADEALARIFFGSQTRAAVSGSPPPVSSAASAAASANFRCYRESERRKAVSSLLSGSSLLIVGPAGLGKTTLACFTVADLREQGITVAAASPASAKQWLVEIATQLELIEPVGKPPSATTLQVMICDHLTRHDDVVIVCDDAHRLPVSLRCWLERLLADGQRMLLVATLPPPRDVFLKLPRLELASLGARHTRQVMEAKATQLGIKLTPAQFASLQERCGGNPMLARRVVREHSLGLESESDHAQWIDGTPLLIAALMIFSVARYLGRGMNATDIYLLGGVLAVAVSVFRLLLWSLPRKSNKLGS